MPIALLLAPATPVRVVDALGRLVVRGRAGATGTAPLNLPGRLPAGVHLVQAGAQTFRLLVE